MDESRWIRSHVERLLQDEWNVCRVEADGDGDYPFRSDTAACWVSVLDAEATLVRVFAYAVVGVKSSLKLLRELNEIQSRSLTTTVFWSADMVIVSQTLSPIGLTQPVLAQAMRAVTGTADSVGVLLAGMFGGCTPHSPAAEAEHEAA